MQKDGTSPYEFDRVRIDAPEGYKTFAFVLPGVMANWGGRLREMAIDSTCKRRNPVFDKQANLRGC